jgi:alkylation response protein AidB-like acyl-CoA dehydrogenase
MNISNIIFNIAKQSLPKISKTEYEALTAGDTWWDEQLFSGKPEWNNPIFNELEMHNPSLSEEELDFINGPTQELCEMIDDYDVNHHRADLSDEAWKFLKDNKFFGMIIPKEYGGLGFSARGHSEVVVKVASRSIAGGVTVMVPNSLGPAELLLHYGTDEEKQEYLPKLATGEHIPCFALTNPHAGSDASNIPDIGYIGQGTYNGEKQLGIYLTIEKRYITLAPIATICGIAFQTQDPYNLLGPEKDLGISVGLVPADHPGLQIGHRHSPMACGFMNGPIRCTNMFIPLSMVLGGQKQLGKGWKMLMECLAVGRSISLPSLACAGGKLASDKVGAYAALRRQFKLPIGKFEGVEEALARIAGYTHIMDVSRQLTLRAIDAGYKPSVLSAICKYHTTEMLRTAIRDGMDIMGGAGISLGPNNFIGNVYASIPIAITVEGANILTRNMIIFGQGAMAAHPYLFNEVMAIQSDEKDVFFSLVRQHALYSIKNFGRTALLGNIRSLFKLIHKKSIPERHVDYLSSAFAMTADTTLLLLQGALKRKERVSARLGDVLSNLYMLSAVISDKNRNNYSEEKKVLVEWCVDYLLYKTQEAFYCLFDNYPNWIIGNVMKRIIFPIGRLYKRPDDISDRKVAKLLLTNNSTRRTLVNGVFTSTDPESRTFMLQNALYHIEQYDEVVKKVSKLEGHTFEGRLERAKITNVISEDEGANALHMYNLINVIVQVDEFEEI